MRQKVVLGLSGGVDSAVAAGLLAAEYEVHCVFLDIGLGGSAAQDAAAVADRWGLPFQVRDIRAPLEERVCTPFAAGYLAGQTPLPCAICNTAVKFPALLAAAEELGGGFVATGHYARVEGGVLKKGRPANDQSYMLARLSREILQRVIFPLGDYEKTEVRAKAGAVAVPVAEKPDSMEICFIPEGDYAAWLDLRGPTPPPGDFVDGEGRVLGQHLGIHHYTLGQGRGLGVSGPHRYFVSAIDPAQNRVVLSDGRDLGRSRVWAEEPNWISIKTLSAPMEVSVRLRHSRTETPAVITPRGEAVCIDLRGEARAPTPGQLAVFYDGDAVVGSGWIAPTKEGLAE